MGSCWAENSIATSVALGRVVTQQDPGGMDEDESVTLSGDDSAAEPASGGKRPKACLYNCTWRGCRGQRPGKKHNVERHVWLLHLRRPMGRQHEAYNAVIHRQLVAPYTRAAGPAKPTGRKAAASDGDPTDRHPGADGSPPGGSEPSPRRQREWPMEVDSHDGWAGPATNGASQHPASAALGAGGLMTTRRTHSNPNHSHPGPHSVQGGAPLEGPDSSYSLPSARATAATRSPASRGDPGQPWVDGATHQQRGDGSWLRSNCLYERRYGTEPPHDRLRAGRAHSSTHMGEYFRGSQESIRAYLDMPPRPVPGRGSSKLSPPSHLGPPSSYDGNYAELLYREQAATGAVHPTYRPYTTNPYARSGHASADDLIGHLPTSAHSVHVTSCRDPLSAPASRHGERYGEWPDRQVWHSGAHGPARDTHHGLSSRSAPDHWDHALPARTHYGPQPGGWVGSHSHPHLGSTSLRQRGEPGPWADRPADTHDGRWAHRDEATARADWAGDVGEAGYREASYHSQPMRE